MLRLLFGLASLTALAIAQLCAPAITRGDVVGVGASAPAFLVDTLDGSSVTSDFKGHPAYINVFATWCTPCRYELPAILNKARSYGDKIVFLLVDEQESATQVKRFAERFGVSTAVGLDRGQFAATFNVSGLPESIFIDRQGVVRYIYLGRIPPNVLDDQLSKLASS